MIPPLDVLAWRGIGIFGYALVFPVTCLAISRAFASRQTPAVPLGAVARAGSDPYDRAVSGPAGASG